MKALFVVLITTAFTFQTVHLPGALQVRLHKGQCCCNMAKACRCGHGAGRMCPLPGVAEKKAPAPEVKAAHSCHKIPKALSIEEITAALEAASIPYLKAASCGKKPSQDLSLSSFKFMPAPQATGPPDLNPLSGLLNINLPLNGISIPQPGKPPQTGSFLLLSF